MNILITGATGFIGRNLVKSLAGDENRIICLTRATSNIEPLKETGAQLAVGDITDPALTDRIFREYRPEIVFHCAAEVPEKNETKLYKVNAEGTRNICEACYRNHVKRLVYLSSIAAISGNPDTPLNDELPYKASSAYGRSKIEAERIVMDFRKKGLCAAIIRPCMVYGREEPHALGRILKAVDLRCIPVLRTPAMDSRLQLADVRNVVQVLELAMKKDEATTGTFIVADREVITIRKFLEIAYDEMDAGSPPVVPSFLMKLCMVIPQVRNRINGYLKDRVYDISRAVDLLGYEPHVSTEEGLREAVRGWKRHGGDSFSAGE